MIGYLPLKFVPLSGSMFSHLFSICLPLYVLSLLCALSLSIYIYIFFFYFFLIFFLLLSLWCCGNPSRSRFGFPLVFLGHHVPPQLHHFPRLRHQSPDPCPSAYPACLFLGFVWVPAVVLGWVGFSLCFLLSSPSPRRRFVACILLHFLIRIRRVKHKCNPFFGQRGVLSSRGGIRSWNILLNVFYRRCSEK